MRNLGSRIWRRRRLLYAKRATRDPFLSTARRGLPPVIYRRRLIDSDRQIASRSMTLHIRICRRKELLFDGRSPGTLCSSYAANITIYASVALNVRVSFAFFLFFLSRRSTYCVWLSIVRKFSRRDSGNYYACFFIIFFFPPEWKTMRRGMRVSRLSNNFVFVKFRQARTYFEHYRMRAHVARDE